MECRLGCALGRLLKPILGLLCIALGASVACSEPIGPESVGVIERYSPPEVYRTWWAEVEACSGLQGDFDRVRWYVKGQSGQFRYRGAYVFAYWWPSHEIVIAGGQVANDMVVRHEMLHDLLGSGEHSPEYFVSRCGMIVR